MHLLACGLYICFTPTGKALFHQKVKNSAYFKDIKRLLDGKQLKPKKESAISDVCPSMTEQFPHFTSMIEQLANPQRVSPIATKYGPLPSICFA